MHRAEIVSAGDAAARIPNNAVVSVCGAWMLVPERLLAAVEERFLETGRPVGLTAVFALCPGGTPDQPGIEHLAHPGLLRRVIGGSYPNVAGSRLRQMIQADALEAYNLPSGMVAGWLREIGAGRPGVVTRKGIGTFVDPRQGGGRMNGRATGDLVSLLAVRGEEHLFLPACPVNVSLIRATTADEAGNLTMEQEPATLTAFVQAAAARASGGIVIAQVRRVVPRGALKPHEVKVPASLVDYLVIERDPLQAGGIRYDPALSGEVRRGLEPVADGSPLERWMARRARREVRPGDVVVLGYGLSAYVPYLMLEEGRFEDAFFTIEQGSFGGLPLTEFGFGSSANPLAILDAASQFDLFAGGCFDLGILSFLQVDARGRVNVHRLDARPDLSAGIGGFLDIASAAKRLVFAGYFTAGGLDVELEDGRLRIVREGKSRKFVERVDHVSFDPRYARAEEILYITERGVFRYDGQTPALVELAPGVDLARDILSQMDFAPALAGLHSQPQ